MIKILLAVGVVLFCSAGYGLFAEKILKLKPAGFTAPMGFVMLLCTLQLCYYPVPVSYTHLLNIKRKENKRGSYKNKDCKIGNVTL